MLTNKKSNIAMKHLSRLALGLWGCLFLAACESQDCTLYNVVGMYSNFYRNGSAVQLNDTLTITACGSDSILLNRKVGANFLTLPLSYWQKEDTLVFSLKGDGFLVRDTIWISKTDKTHFESPDCPVAIFHDITHVHSSHQFIDTVLVTRPAVNYDKTENLQIYISAAD